VKIAAKAVDECLRRLDPRIAAVLLYGPDGGRVRERAIEIELKSGDRVRIEGCTDAGVVVRIISALRRA